MAKQFPHGRVVVDTETTGLNPWKGARIFLAGMEDEAGNVRMAEPGKEGWGLFMRVLADKFIPKFVWNGMYDLLMTRESRIPWNGDIHDGMLLTYMDNEYEPNLKLKDTSNRYLNEVRPKRTSHNLIDQILRTLRRKGKKDANYSDVPRPIMRKYLGDDLDDTMRMCWLKEHIITGPQRRVYEIERKVMPYVVEMRRWGVNIDREYCKKAILQNRARVAELHEQLTDLAGCKFKYGGDQLGQVMMGLGLDTGVRNKSRVLKDGTVKEGSMKTGVEYLHGIKGHPFMKALMELRALEKITGTYFEAFLEHAVDGVVHPNFWPFGSEDHGIKTGRFSSSDPNFQNIPGGGRGNNVEMLRDPGLVRRAVVPRPGYVFLFADYKQIEFVLFACAAGAERILDDIRKGVDFHTSAAKLIFGQDCFSGLNKEETKKLRFQAKELNFSLIFGMGTKRYAQRAGIPLRDAKANKNRYFSNLPEARNFMLTSQGDLLRDGYVQDQFGRRYHVPRELCYKAANALCQGPAALVNKRGIPRVYEGLKGLDAHPFITVHDELGVEVRREHVWDAKIALEKGMEDRENFPVPITTEVSVAEKSWADKVAWEDAKDTYRPKRTSVSTSR